MKPHLADIRNHRSKREKPFIELLPPIPLRNNVLGCCSWSSTIRGTGIVVPW